MANLIPEQSSNDARHQLQQADRGAVPADTARAQMLRHEVCGNCLADGAEDPLIQSVEDEQRGDEKDVLRQRKAEIGTEEDDKRGEQDILSAPRVGECSCRIGNQAATRLNAA